LPGKFVALGGWGNTCGYIEFWGDGPGCLTSVFVGQGLVEFGEFLGYYHGLGFFG